MRLCNGDLRGCVEWVRRQAALSIVLVFCGFGRSMLFTLPLVGWVIRSILETDHMLDMPEISWSGSMAPGFKTSGQKP